MGRIDFRKTSFTRIPNFVILEVNKGISATDLMVYTYLASKIDNTHKECTIATAHIAKGVRLSQRTVSRSLSNLSDIGFISIKHRYREDGGRTASTYYLLNE